MNKPLALIFFAALIGLLVARQWVYRPAVSRLDNEPSTNAFTSPITPNLLPEFSLKNRADELQSIRSWPGKTLLINFWATWCAPCREEIPTLTAMQNKHAVDGLQVVGIAVDFRDAVLKYAENMHINYPLLIGEEDGLKAVDAFGLESVGFPYSVFVDVRNNVVARYIGALNARQIEATLAVMERINRGDLEFGAGKTEVAATLAELRTPSPSAAD